jgi:hypothetical protein
MKKFTKDELSKYNKKSEFPDELIEIDSLNYKEILFKDAFENTMVKDKKNDLSESYFAEDNSMQAVKTNKRQWRNDGTVGPTYAKTKPQQPRYNISGANSFSINCLKDEGASLIFNNNVISEIEEFGTGRSITPFNINALYFINDKLKIGKNEPLWYLKNGKSSIYGPISSKEVEAIYMDKKIDGLNEVRFIDIFKQKNKPSYMFFKLKDLENPLFLKDIDGNSAVKYIEELEKVKTEINKQESMKKESISAGVRAKAQPVEEFVNTGNNTNKQMNTKNNKKPKEPIRPRIEVPINTGPSVIDEFDEEEKEGKSGAAGNQGKKGKKKKGKPVDFDIKTGFFTITEQEKKYEPMYICGDLDNN